MDYLSENQIILRLQCLNLNFGCQFRFQHTQKPWNPALHVFRRVGAPFKWAITFIYAGFICSMNSLTSMAYIGIKNVKLFFGHFFIFINNCIDKYLTFVDFSNSDYLENWHENFFLNWWRWLISRARSSCNNAFFHSFPLHFYICNKTFNNILTLFTCTLSI